MGSERSFAISFSARRLAASLAESCLRLLLRKLMAAPLTALPIHALADKGLGDRSGDAGRLAPLPPATGQEVPLLGGRVLLPG